MPDVKIPQPFKKNCCTKLQTTSEIDAHVLLFWGRYLRAQLRSAWIQREDQHLAQGGAKMVERRGAPFLYLSSSSVVIRHSIMHIPLLQKMKTGKGPCLRQDVYWLQHIADFHSAVNRAVCFWWAGLTEHRLLVCGGVWRVTASACSSRAEHQQRGWIGKKAQVRDYRELLGRICQNRPERADKTRQTAYQWVSILFH